MESTPFVVVFDLDGTLSDTTGRLHLLEPDLPAFDDAAAGDPPHHALCRLVRSLWEHPGCEPVFVSARPERLRDDTLEWLARHCGVGPATRERPVRLELRATDDSRPDPVIKTEAFARLGAAGFPPALAIDDNPSVIATLRAAKIPCLDVGTWADAGRIAYHLTARLLVFIVPDDANASDLRSSLTERFAGYAIPDPRAILTLDDARAEIRARFEADAGAPGPLLDARIARFAWTYLLGHAKARLDAGLDVVLVAPHSTFEDARATVTGLGCPVRTSFCFLGSARQGPCHETATNRSGKPDHDRSAAPAPASAARSQP